jgi:hypothetical protein
MLRRMLFAGLGAVVGRVAHVAMGHMGVVGGPVRVPRLIPLGGFPVLHSGRRMVVRRRPMMLTNLRWV